VRLAKRVNEPRRARKQPAGVENRRGTGPIVSDCFYNGKSNSSVWVGSRAQVRAAHSVCSLSTQGRGLGGEGVQIYRETLTPHPSLSQPKSDLSDLGRLKVPNSGKPEFGGRESRPSSRSTVVMPSAAYSSVTRGQKRVEDARRRAYDPRVHHSWQEASCEADGPPGQARG
jgi:hypothetical protein